MISLEFYIYSLLILGAISLYFIIRVLLKQLPMLKSKFTGYDESTQKTLVKVRGTLFKIVLTIIILSSVMDGINILTLFVETDRPKQISIASYIYVLVVHIVLVLLSYLVSSLYQLANSRKLITDTTQHGLEVELQEEKDKR